MDSDKIDDAVLGLLHLFRWLEEPDTTSKNWRFGVVTTAILTHYAVTISHRTLTLVPTEILIIGRQ